MAQAAASIVGVVGAVLASRLIDHVVRIKQDRQQITIKVSELLRELQLEAMRCALRTVDSRGPDADVVNKAAWVLRSLMAKRVTRESLTEVVGALADLRGCATEPQEQEALQKLWFAAVGLLVETVGFKDRVLFRHFVVVWMLLAWMTLFGVLFPLAALPGHATGWHGKDFLLKSFSIGAVGFVLYLAFEIWQLHRFRHLSWRTGEFDSPPL